MRLITITTLALALATPAIAGKSELVDCSYVIGKRGTVTPSGGLSKGRIACTKCTEDGSKTVYTYNTKVLKTAGEGGCNNCGSGGKK